MFNGVKEHIVRVDRATLYTYWYARMIGRELVVLECDGESFVLKVDVEFPTIQTRYVLKRDCTVIATG